MNTSKLKTFAQQSRRILMQGVKQKLRYWGFNEKGEVIDEPMQVGGGVILRGEPIDDPTVLPKWEALRKSIRRHGLEATEEEAAYTWFNRFMAIRILSKNGYDPAQLEYEGNGSRIPVILAKARRGITGYLTAGEKERLQLFLTNYSQEHTAFAILITGYCHSHKLLNRVFGRLNDFTELLLPDNILADKGFIHLLNTTDAIAEDDYKEVELIGWLYQFYISEKKDEVFKGFKKNKKAEAEDIPAATQIFTPNWIVKYMVQNTAGRIWLDHHPDSPLREKMKYLVEPPVENPSEIETNSNSTTLPTEGESSFSKGGVERQRDGGLNHAAEPSASILKENPPESPFSQGGHAPMNASGLLKNGDPIYLKLLDPATGSGHILVEGFALLYEMYMEEYYLPAEAVENILTKNLFGLELDLRAAQLARFAVLLAAAKKEPEILKKDILPRIYAMPEPAEFTQQEVRDFLGSEGLQHEKVLVNALQLMQQAQNLGSVMQFNVNEEELRFFKQRWEKLQKEAETNLTKQTLTQKLEPFLSVFFTFTSRYEAIAANPPYMGQKSMNKELGKYLQNNYPISKADLMTVFMEVIPALTKTNGFFALINLPSWLFLSTFEKLRKEYLKNYHFESLLHMGRGIFGIDFGSVAFALKKQFIPDGKGNYFRLHERNFQHIYYTDIERLFLYSKGNTQYKYDFSMYRDKEGTTEIPANGTEKGLRLYFPNVPQSNFSKIPGSPIAYWASEKTFNCFEILILSNAIGDAKPGIQTGDNERFVRFWFEVEKLRINKKWFFYRKGGPNRKWYGNVFLILNWENDGLEIKNFRNDKGILLSRPQNINYQRKRCITWSLTSSNGFSMRYAPEGQYFDVNGMSFFLYYENQLDNYLSLFNSKCFFHFLKILNPTLAFQAGDILKVPVPRFNEIGDFDVINRFNINNSKDDWDSSETSWDFHKYPLFQEIEDIDYTLEESFEKWQEKVTRQFYQLHTNEEELNRIFIDIYGLNEELDPVVPLKDITILQEELDRSALEKTEQELRKHRQWKLEEGKWQLYVNGELVSPPAEGELPATTIQPQLPIKKDVVARQLISYATGCMMGRYSLEKPGLILANQGETLEDYHKIVQSSEFKVQSRRNEELPDAAERGAAYSTPVISTSERGTSSDSPLRGDARGAFVPDDDAIIPLMGSNCGFSDDALHRLRHFIEVVWGSETLTQNINFLQECLGMDLEKYLTSQNNFWKDHCSRYKKKPIYWLFSSPTGAFQALVYMHRMNKYTVQKIRDNYLLKHLQWLSGQISQLQSRSSTLVREEQKYLDGLQKALKECEEYDKYLKDIADRQIEIDLDDGVSVNYPKFEPVVAKIK